MNNRLIWLIVIGAVLLFSGEKKKPSSLSGLRRKRKRRSLLGVLPDDMYNLQQSIYSVESGDFGDWMRGELGLDPAVFGSMKLIELKDRLFDRMEKRRKRQERVRADSAANEAIEYANARDANIARGIPIYTPKLRNMTLRQVWEMAQGREQQPTWERKNKVISEKQGQMTLFGGLTRKTLIKKYSRPNEEYTIEEILDNGHKINDDGTIVLYHATTADKAIQIKKTGILKRPIDAPDSYGIYLSTSPKVSESYGDGTVVKVRVKVKDLHMDDVFPDGRIDFRIPTRMGSYKPINLSGIGSLGYTMAMLPEKQGQMTLFGKLKGVNYGYFNGSSRY